MPSSLAARLCATALAFLGAAITAQDTATQVQRLSAPEPEQREDARRRLARLGRAELPVDALLACVQGEGDAAPPAAQVLALHPDVHPLLRRHVDATRASVALLEVALPALSTDDVWQIAMTARAKAPRLAELALAEVARRGQLFAGPLVELLAGSDAPAASVFAAELAAHGADTLPPPVAAAIAGSATARCRLLRALADCPRDDLVAWLLPWIDRQDDPSTSLLAIAALPASRQAPAHARIVLRLLAAETLPFLPDLAAARFSSKVADGLVAAAHGALLEGKKIGDLLPLLGNVSATGEAHLLGLAMTVAADEREEVCRWLDSRDAAALAQRIGAALDDESPLDECFLRRAGRHLTSPARVARVVAELKAGEPRCSAAFTALVEADRFDAEMLRVAAGDPAMEVPRTRDLLRLTRGVLPLATAQQFLGHHDASVRLSAVHYLAVPEMGEAVEARLAEVLRADPDDRVRGACARALSALASDARAEAAFTFAFGSAYADEAVSWLIERPRPFGVALLRSVRAGQKAQRALDDIDTGRVRLGDLAPLPALLDRLAELPPRLVKRLAPALAALEDAALVAKVRAAAGDQALSEILREPLVAALAARADAHVEFLQAIHQQEDDDGIRLAALRGLLATPVGPAMLADLGAAVGQRPLRPRDEDLAFEVLGAATLPLAPAVVEFAARLVLLAPLANPVAEASLALSDGGESADFPLVQPLCELIRRDARAEHGDAIARVLAQATAHRAAHALSRRRLGHLLAHLALAEPAFATAAPALAQAIVDAPDRDPQWLGPAWLLLARAAEARGDLAGAAVAYERAHQGLLHHSRPAVQRRRFLPDSDPAHGVVPMAAVAARPALLRARLALARGERDGAQAALATARARASADAATHAAIDALAAEIGGK